MVEKPLSGVKRKLKELLKLKGDSKLKTEAVWQLKEAEANEYLKGEKIKFVSEMRWLIFIGLNEE